MSKYNVVWYSDSPTCQTGFGVVARNLLKVLNETNKYNFNIVGINHDGSYYDQKVFPYKIDPATSYLRNEMDVYGRNVLLRKLQTEDVDILFMLQDTFLVKTFIDKLLEIRANLPKEKQFVIVYYYPIDGVPHRDWIEDCVCKIDFPVTYTEYAKQECYKVIGREFPLDIIHHGVSKSTFKVLPEEIVAKFKRDTFPNHANDFFILNVNRNQPRKDLYRSLQAFKIFHDKYPKSFYFLNCQANDVGGDIVEIASNCGLEIYKDYSFPSTDSFNANQGLPIEVVNMFYNVADLVISSTIGEGWGLSSVEAMATKTPILFPRNTSLVEIVGENEERGYLCKSGSDIEHFICLGAQDNNILRPTTDIQDMALKMEQVYNNYDEAKAKAEKAYEWVPTWEKLGKQWLQIFRRAEDKLKEIRSI